NGTFCRSFQCGLGDHLDRAAWALFEARGASGAEVEFYPIKTPLAQLDDCLLRARRVAVVALEAVAAGQAPHCFIARLALGEAGDDFVEAGALFHRQFGVLSPIGIEKHGQVELVEGDSWVWRRLLIDAAAQPCVNVPRRLLAMADRRGHRS